MKVTDCIDLLPESTDSVRVFDHVIDLFLLFIEIDAVLITRRLDGRKFEVFVHQRLQVIFLGEGHLMQLDILEVLICALFDVRIVGGEIEVLEWN